MARSVLREVPFMLGVGAGIAAGQVGGLAAALVKLTLFGKRQPLWHRPDDLGLAFEDVTFVAGDGVALRGWFIPASLAEGATAPAIVFVHGWPWNRLGNQPGQTRIPDQEIDFLQPAKALHAAGFHVLLFDLRNHGTSDAAVPITFGLHEARDVVAAVSWLRTRPEVDASRIGAIGYSMGANALLYGIPNCQPVRAAVLVQPTAFSIFAPRFARSIVGPIGQVLPAALPALYRALNAPSPMSVNPAQIAHLLGETTALYIQGAGDPWGTVADVQAMARATPRALPPIITPTTDRYQGYAFIEKYPEQIVAFFREQF